MVIASKQNPYVAAAHTCIYLCSRYRYRYEQAASQPDKYFWLSMATRAGELANRLFEKAASWKMEGGLYFES